MCGVSKGLRGLQRNVHMTFLENDIDMWGFPKQKYTDKPFKHWNLIFRILNLFFLFIFSIGMKPEVQIEQERKVSQGFF